MIADVIGYSQNTINNNLEMFSELLDDQLYLTQY